MSSSTASFRYNLRSSTVTPSKGDLAAAQALMALRSWTAPAPTTAQGEWYRYDTTQSQWVQEQQQQTRRVQPDRAARHQSKTQKQQFWPTTTIAERVKARRAGFTEVSQY